MKYFTLFILTIANCMYANITVDIVQQDGNTAVYMGQEKILNLTDNRHLIFRATNENDHWIGQVNRPADLGWAYQDLPGYKSKSVTYQTQPSWFELELKGTKAQVDGDITTTIAAQWNSQTERFEYTLSSQLTANLEKWYENSRWAAGASAGAAGLGIAGCSSFSSTRAKPDSNKKQPNIVLIMADDIGIEGFGCYGGTSYKTAVIDNMAKEGVMFTHCYSMPLCTPTRVKLMTGKSNLRNYKKFGILPTGERTFGHILQDCGYNTCIVGKWQLYGSPVDITGKDWWFKGTYPTDAGFDEYCLWQIDKVGSRYADPVIKQNGKYLEGLEDKYGPDVFCDYALDFIERNQDNPFFLYHSMALPHSPFVPTPISEDWHKDRDNQDTKYFADMVQYIDIIVGRILDKLDELGLREDTLVMFTSDNGTHRDIRSEIDGQSMRGGKGRMRDDGTHVPLVVSWEGQTPKGKVCEDLVDFSDFVPTFADIGGCKEDLSEIDGQSFLPQILGKKGNPRDWIFLYFDKMTFEIESNPIYFVRNQRWKLYGDDELYDISQDPREQSAIMPEDDTAKTAKIRTKLREAITSFGL